MRFMAQEEVDYECCLDSFDERVMDSPPKMMSLRKSVGSIGSDGSDELCKESIAIRSKLFNEEEEF